jgi:hypothetical protein
MIRRNEPIGKWAFNLSRRHSHGGWKKGVNAASRRLSHALYYVHLKGEAFSYKGYHMLDLPNVPHLPIADMGFNPRIVTILTKFGYTHSTDVVSAYYADLAAQKGVGEKCLQAIRHWINIMTSASRSSVKS